jgi:predicted nucleic acid-binding protein
VIVLDTNVLSEVLKPMPSEIVLRWLAKQNPRTVFTTAITQAEVLYGVELLPAGKRRARLLTATENVFTEDFHGRVLPFDEAAARVFAKIGATRSAVGLPISQFDAMIAAIARSRGADAVATRNTADFERCGVEIINPWKA